MKQRLFRVIVRGGYPRVVFRADEPCLAMCWLSSRTFDAQENHPVLLSDHEPENIYEGATLDGNLKIPIFLDKGGVIYATSRDETHLSISVVPAAMLGAMQAAE